MIVLHVLGGLFFPRNSGNRYDNNVVKRLHVEDKKEIKGAGERTGQMATKGRGGEQWPDLCGGGFSMLAAVQHRQHHCRGNIDNLSS